MSAPGNPSPSLLWHSWRLPFAVALAWVVLDGFYLDLGMPSMLLAVLLSVLWLPFNLLAPRFRGRRAERLGRFAIYMAAAVAAMGVTLLNRQIAQAGAEKLIVAAQAYRTQTGVWPESLGQLVPVFISSIPRAKYVLTDRGFSYTAGADGHRLIYVVTPPFGRRVYHFESERWTTLD